MPMELNEAWLQDILDNHYEETLSKINAYLAGTRQDPITGCLVTPTQSPCKVRYRGNQIAVYRLVYCLAHRTALPFRVVVRHRCHNRCCINPAHLIAGSRRDNKHDDWAHAAYGVNHALLPRD